MKTNNNAVKRGFILLYFILTPIILLGHAPASNTTDPEDPEKQRTYETTRINGSAPVIDGSLDDPAWQQVDWGGNFIQFVPEEKANPSQNTQFKILYDDKNLYVAIRAFDTEPEKIVKRVGRRDGFDGDWVEINIDSYNDKRTAFSFTASAAGVKGDEFISNNGQNWDSNWDPIWYLRTNIDAEGWTAEFRIPLSQLRFSAEEEQVWGIQVMRNYFREEERSIWQFIPRNDPGWVHKFGELRGIKGIKPQKQVEIMPYVVGKVDKYEAEEGNPFADGMDETLTLGVDGKIGITNDISLDFTINPDFGQVEADPSQLNLSAFQVFFEERRPFFIEGNNILNFPITDFRNDNLFYSRRIGGRPKGWPSSAGDNTYVKIPDNTSILAAAKVTGKNKNGLSFGILESVTAREYAELDDNGVRSKEEVEPLTNYFVARASQDLNGGSTVFGGMVTSVHRQINTENLEFLTDNAWSGGVDLLHQWKDMKYYISVNSVFSSLNGSPESITRTQEASERFFQRPDNKHREVDTTLTTLTGSGGQFKIGKQEGKFNYEFGTSYLSPGLDLNNQGFLMSTDNITQWIFTSYRVNQPFKIFRMMRANLVQFTTWDFGGDNNGNGFNTNFGTQFKNFWGLEMGAQYEFSRASNADLRGGPSMRYPDTFNLWYWTGTDSRKKFRVMFNNWYNWGSKEYRFNAGYWMRFQYRPIDVLDVSISPSITFNRNDQQYVTTEEYQSNPRYITAQINQKTLRAEIRLNYNINPNLSITYWGQPFITQGEYVDFKRITNSTSENYYDRFHALSNNEIIYDADEGHYSIDEDGNGRVDYTIEDPNFNFLQFRSNAVLRWEYKPGSILFLVWTQNRTAFPEFSEVGNSLGNLTEDLFSVTPRNIFLIKYTYRFIL